MAQRPPPFAALRALEAACRHRSYSAAAAELDVTHSAISQAVRRLEEETGCKLFTRRNSAMEPTTASLALAAAYADAARSVSLVLRRVSDPSPDSLALKAPAQLARMWLTPLLPELALRFPSLRLSLLTEATDDDACDLAIQAGPPRAGHEAQALADPALYAFASPTLLRRLAVEGPADLLAAPLLIERDGAAWTAWFAAAGLATEDGLHGVRFDDRTGLALEAAAHGAGVALGDSLSARLAVDRGELVPVCASVSIEGQPLWLTWRAGHPKSALIRPLVVWLTGHAAEASNASAPARPVPERLSA